MSEIIVKDLSINFRVYNNKNPGLKDTFANILNRKPMKSFSDFTALNNISFEVTSGERVGIIGNNGAGKSTLLKAVCNIYEPSVGLINVSGSIAPLLEVGAGFHPEFSGRENIYLNGAILGVSITNLREIEKEVIEFAELADFIDTPVKYYSTGMYMRLAFSLATAIRPDILILDEVFSGGDVGFIDKSKARMHSFIESANILLFVSHDERLVRSICNRVIWLSNGEIVLDGNVNEVLDKYLGVDKLK